MNFDDHIVLKNLVSTSPIGICILSADTLVCEVVNEAFLTMSGKSPEIVQNKHYWDTFAETAPYHSHLMANVIKEAESYYSDEEEVKLIRRGKEEIVFVSFAYIPLQNKEGFVTKVAVWVRENTLQVKQRKAVQDLNDELAASNRELETLNEELLQAHADFNIVNAELVKNTGDLMFTIDAAGLATFDLNPVTGKFSGNDLLKSWFGLAPDEEMELHKATDVIEEADRLRVLKAVKEALHVRSGGKYEVEFAISNPDNLVQKVVNAKGKTLFDENGMALRLSGTLQDITEQKKDDERKNDFIGMVSHEMKTPLTTLSVYVQMMQDMAGAKEDVMVSHMLDKANKQVKKLNKLINGFLNVSRLESGKILIDKQDFDLAVLVKEAEEESIATIVTHNVVFAPVEHTLVNADRDKIGHVVTNLISNAVKYSANGTTINIACVTLDKYAQVSVRDEGIGITKEDQAKVFDRYFRVESSLSKTVSGFGIGLYLSAEIIYRHNGKIWVESEIGKGSTFYFSLPVM